MLTPDEIRQALDLEVLPPLLKVGEVARVLGLSDVTIYRWVSAEQIPSIRIGGSIRIPTRWLEETLI